ncbi:MAG: type II toxin-antitoxin system HicB family antitoxin [Lachnoclostridium sp.]|jgi:predicted RNase H-like HicB family nuclease|nr:type II toxin-antitoxin system HicB family antitoxin [Lachnoclostridium sp.]
MKKVYPVILTQTNDIVLVEVPDLEIFTEGKSMADAIEMARDAIGLKVISYEDDQIKIPEPSKLETVQAEKGTFSNEGINYVSLVDVDFIEYRRKTDNKTVRRNVTLPNWLDYEAKKAQVNVSKILQDALMSILNVSR